VAAARSIGRQIIVFSAGTEYEIENAFESMAQQQVGALVVSPDAYLYTRRGQIVSLSARHAHHFPIFRSRQGRWSDQVRG
jgi:hypothetical protein